MIDAIDLIFRKYLQLPCSTLGRFQIVPERLFDHHPAPVSTILVSEPRVAEMLYYFAEQAAGR